MTLDNVSAWWDRKCPCRPLLGRNGPVDCWRGREQSRLLSQAPLLTAPSRLHSLSVDVVSLAGKSERTGHGASDMDILKGPSPWVGHARQRATVYLSDQPISYDWWEFNGLSRTSQRKPVGLNPLPKTVSPSCVVLATSAATPSARVGQWPAKIPWGPGLWPEPGLPPHALPVVRRPSPQGGLARPCVQLWP